MITSDLVRRIWHKNQHLRRQEVETIVHAIFDEVTATLVRGDRVELRGFGAFSVRVHEARTGRNPRTGVRVAVPKSAVPHFRVTKEMKERLIRQTD
jgi:integration host factor subunit beta